VLERGTRRDVATPPQTRQSAVERRADIARALHVERRLVGLRVAIVDDVVTTGATINALAGALKAAGAARCIAVAVARTPEPNQKRNV
jgi:predicted amidophosphoribosyltransferase